jgi:hypothetical protein
MRRASEFLQLGRIEVEGKNSKRTAKNAVLFLLHRRKTTSLFLNRFPKTAVLQTFTGDTKGDRIFKQMPVNIPLSNAYRKIRFAGSLKSNTCKNSEKVIRKE